MEGTPLGGPQGYPGSGGAGQYPPQGGVPPQAPPPPYGQPQYGGQPGPGVGERASEIAHTVGRHIRTPETKPFYKSSEFLVWALVVVGLFVAGAVIDNGDHGDVLKANTVWILVSVVSFAYIISRGISKAGTRYRDDAPGGYGRGF